MLKKLIPFITVAIAFVLFFAVFSATAGEKTAFPAHEGKMMLEHEGLKCETCHRVGK